MFKPVVPSNTRSISFKNRQLNYKESHNVESYNPNYYFQLKLRKQGWDGCYEAEREKLTLGAPGISLRKVFLHVTNSSIKL